MGRSSCPRRNKAWLAGGVEVKARFARTIRCVALGTALILAVPLLSIVVPSLASAAAGPPAELSFVQGPSNTDAGAVITPAVKVAVEDANGNVETSDNTTQVTLAIGTNPAGGTLSGGSSVTVSAGIATFSGLSINTAGTGYTLTASSTPTYSPATSAAFNVTASSDWTTYLNGNDRSGFASSENGFNPTTVPNLGLAWKTSDAGPSRGVFSQPIVSNGLVYWGSFDGYERATTTSGNLVWQQNLGTVTSSGCSDPSEAGVASTATVTTDIPVGTATSVLYVGGGDAKVYALNAATGAVLWSYAVGPISDYFVWSSPAVFGNSVYIGVASFGGGTDSGSSCPEIQGQLLQLNRVTGALQNTFDVVPNGCMGGGVWGSPTVDAAAGTIYFGTGSKPPPGGCTSEPLVAAVVEVNASDLSLVGSWAVPPAQLSDDSDFGATPTLFNGVIGGQSVPLVGVINKNGIFYAFERDALDSGPVWQTPIAIGGGNPPAGQGDVASAAFDGTTLYVGGDNTANCSGSLNALNPSTGAFIWQHCFTDGGFVLGGVTSTSGGVVAVGEGNNIAVFSSATGALLYSYPGTGPFWGPPSIADGTLYEGDMSGNLYALTVNQTPAAKLGFVQGPSNTTAGVVITPAVKVAVEDANGNVETFDNTTQVTLAIGTNPAGGTLSGGSSVTVSAGIATFSGLSINTAGTGYTLTASSTPTYSPATSAAFNLTNPQATNFTISVNNASSATITAGGEARFSETGLPPSATGTLSFSTDEVGLCSISLSGLANESTSCSTSPALPVGSYIATAKFSDTDGNFLDSTSSNSVTLTVSPQVPAANDGYWLVGSDGGVFTFGDAQFYGSTGAIHLNQPIVGMAATPDGKGYWLVASDGGIFSFGDAQFYGSTGAIHLNKPIVGMASTPDGKGYWLVASDGGIFSFGDAQFYGSTGAIRLNKPIVGMASTPDGKGYWLVASDGGIFTFGDAAFYGSTGAIHLNQPIVGMTATPSGNGYWLVAADGGIFTFGDAPFFGSTGNIRLNSPIVGMTPTPDGKGYWFTASDGGVFSYGDAPFFGSLGGQGIDDVVGMAR